MKWSFTQIRIGFLAAAFALILWGFRELVFVQMPGMFQDAYEDLSYGWYVPVFSLYVLWTERAKVRAAVGEPSWGGVVAMLPFLFLGFLGVRGLQIRFGVIAFAGLCFTVPWALFGRKMAKQVLFPALFLLFCIPLATYLDIVTVHLRLLAVSVAYGVLQGCGVDVVRTGTALTIGGFGIDVAAPCSGIRSIFALTALTAGYAYFNQPTWLRRAILFACAIPLAVFGNVMRILTICLVGAFASGEFAMGFYHDYSGYVVFIAAIALMVACGEAITWVFTRFTRGGKK